MKLYVYEVDSKKIVAEYEGKDNQECEAKMAADGHEGWGDGDWNDAGLANAYTSEGLHY